LRQNDHLGSPRQGFKLGVSSDYEEAPLGAALGAKGRFLIELRDSQTGELLHYLEKDNVITNDGGILAAILFASGTTGAAGISMLAVGTGATGPLLNPDAPDPRQRKLNAELVAPNVGRKTFASVTYRTSAGAVSAVPTNVVDFTTVFGNGEAEGPLNEMGLIRPLNPSGFPVAPNPDSFPTYDTTVDVQNFDVLINYLTFPVINKPALSTLTITWRLSF
jgi:hypothetical protein